MKPKLRAKLKAWMKRRISFRLHMFFIMLTTIFLGMISNFVMLNTLGITHPALRYPLTVLFSYGWFLLFIRIYIRNILIQSSNGSLLDTLDFIPNSSSGKSSGDSSKMVWEGGGGDFSGAGSSGTWECATDVAQEGTTSAVTGLADDEGGAIVVLVIGGIVGALVFGSGAYFIWHSPEILSECLLQVIMVSGMRKRMKKFSEGEWMSHMFKVTKWPFLLVLVVSLFSGAFIRGMCPEAKNLKDVRMNCWR